MERFFNHRYGMVHYQEKGKGDTVVLLHGYLESLEIWNEFAGKLTESYRVITVDLPGHGKSDILAEIHTMELMAAVIKDLLEDLNTGRVFMAGHSLGGYVTLAFVDLFPEYLTGYCLIHSHPMADSPEVVEKREREIILVKAGKKDLMYPENVARMFATKNLERFSANLSLSREIASRIPAEGIISVLRGMMIRPSRLKQMEEGIIPCLWILGLYDNYIPCETIRANVKLPGNAECVVLNDSGHMGFVEEEELSLQYFKQFIEKCLGV